MSVSTYYRCCRCDKPLGVRDKTKLFCDDCSIIERDPQERELFEKFHQVRVDDLRAWNKRKGFLKQRDNYMKSYIGCVDETRNQEREGLIPNEYRYDCFEVCPACDEWRMRVRIGGFEWNFPGGLRWITDWYSFDLRCLNCGYSNRFFELDPISSSEEEELKGILWSERRRLRRTGEATERKISSRDSRCPRQQGDKK